jgi:predicted enzyme related to lactoylglutathione lyase
MLNFNSVMLGTAQPKVLGEFYEKVIGRPSDMQDEGGYGWQVGSAFFMVGEHSEMGGKAKDPGRLMCNFETANVQEEFERIKAAGAIVIKEPYEMGEMSGFWIATFADPDGNYFQLMAPFPGS